MQRDRNGIRRPQAHHRDRALAKQAAGSALVQFGDTVVLAAVTVSDNVTTLPFFPLTVEYREKTYAAGKIPGGFIKREGRPHDKEILSARIIDRSIRPLFPEGFKNEVQVFVYVLSADQENDADVLGAPRRVARAQRLADSVERSARRRARGPRRGQVDAEPHLPAARVHRHGPLVTGSEDSIVMVEGGALEVSEADMLEGHQGGAEGDPGAHRASRTSMLSASSRADEDDVGQGRDRRGARRPGSRSWPKGRITRGDQPEGQARPHRGRREGVKKEIAAQLATRVPRQGEGHRHAARRHRVPRPAGAGARTRASAWTDASSNESGRSPSRPAVLPRAHGSALFTRGQTQALVAVTLGTANDEQRIDSIDDAGETTKSFMLHYNFPPFSTGEVARCAAPAAARSGTATWPSARCRPLLPAYEDVPVHPAHRLRHPRVQRLVARWPRSAAARSR